MSSISARVDTRARERVLCVPVNIPHGAVPAAVSSVVEAIEKVPVVLIHARQGEVIAHADQLAEIATGPLEPSTELLEDRVQRVRTSGRCLPRAIG